jgi:hypothetical protein
MVLQEKDASGEVRIVTPIALDAIRLLAMFDHVDSLQPPLSFSLDKQNSGACEDIKLSTKLNHYALRHTVCPSQVQRPYLNC